MIPHVLAISFADVEQTKPRLHRVGEVVPFSEATPEEMAEVARRYNLHQTSLDTLEIAVRRLEDNTGTDVQFARSLLAVLLARLKG